MDNFLEKVDREWYLQRYPDVKQANIDPEYHYKEHGFSEGRQANQMSTPKLRTDKALFLIDKLKIGLEIGPSHQPIAPKKLGYNVHILDHLSAEGLREKYSKHNLDMKSIEDVDFVWEGQPLQELTEKTNFYNWIIASHVIEHMPDIISFFQQCEIILKETGILSLVIPDKRYCFDFFSPITSTGMLIDAYDSKYTKPTPGKVFDHFSNASKIEENIGWNKDTNIENIKLVSDQISARKQFNDAKNPQNYVDVHCWRFTPESFEIIINDLNLLGLINLEIAEKFPTSGHEFYVSLQKKPETSRTTEFTLHKRLSLLKKINSI